MAEPISLQSAICAIAVIPSTQVKAFFKRRLMHEATRKALLAGGYFCQSREGLLYYFDKNQHLLFDMGQQKFKHALSRFTGLSETEGEYRFILNMLQVEAAGTDPVDVRSLSHYDRKAGVIAISNGAGGVYTRKPAGEWELKNNGADDILFFTDEDAVIFKPDFTSKGAFDWMFDRLLLSDVSTSYGTLNREQQIKFFRMWLYHQFFPSLRLTNMIPAFIGRRGSAKTTAMRLIGRLLVGPEWEVSDLRASDKGEEAVIASLCNRTFVGLDNADNEIKWLEDMLRGTRPG